MIQQLFPEHLDFVVGAHQQLAQFRHTQLKGGVILQEVAHEMRNDAPAVFAVCHGPHCCRAL